MTGLHTRPVTPPTQTATSHGAPCEAHFKKGEFNAFKLVAKFRSGIWINLMMWEKKTKKNLILNTPGLAGVSSSMCFNVHMWLIECLFFCLANVFPLISPDIITPVGGDKAWLLPGNRVRRRPRFPPPKHRHQQALPTHQGKGMFLRTCQPAMKIHTPSPHPFPVLPPSSRSTNTLGRDTHVRLTAATWHQRRGKWSRSTEGRNMLKWCFTLANLAEIKHSSYFLNFLWLPN